MSRIVIRSLLLSGGLFIIAGSHGAVPVTDLNSPNALPPATSRQPASPRTMTLAQQSGNPTADLHYQLQMIQEELRTLRGMVEEQANEIRQLKQRQMDDYMDLDRRLSGNNYSGGAPAAAVMGAATPSSSQLGSTSTPKQTSRGPAGTTGAAQAASDKEQLQDYTRAYNLLKDRKIDEAINAFDAHIASYPTGPYAANAHYWLGEIYLLRNDLPKAEAAFAAVVDNFPAHRKAGDAAFKLGTVYFQEGKKDKARTVLKKVADGSSSAAGLARAYLRDNLQ